MHHLCRRLVGIHMPCMDWKPRHLALLPEQQLVHPLHVLRRQHLILHITPPSTQHSQQHLLLLMVFAGDATRGAASGAAANGAAPSAGAPTAAELLAATSLQHDLQQQQSHPAKLPLCSTHTARADAAHIFTQ